jgi:voltage-gated potassium channel
MTLKDTIAAYLDDTNRETGGWVTGAIALLIVASSIIFVLETYELGSPWDEVLTSLDWGILAIFTIEYGLRVWTAERWWQYVLSPYGLVDLVAIFPFVLGFVDMRFVRLLRWLRVLRLARFLGDRAIIGRFTAADTLAVLRIVFTIIAIIFIYAGVIFQVEQRYHPDTFRTFLDAAYFAVVTMTTVGYGDITPVSDAGRLLTILMILTGIALIPTQLGDLIRRILKVSRSLQVDCPRCYWSVHEPDAQFCKRCGTALPTVKGADARPQSELASILPVIIPLAPRAIIEIPEATWKSADESTPTPPSRDGS